MGNSKSKKEDKNSKNTIDTKESVKEENSDKTKKQFENYDKTKKQFENYDAADFLDVVFCIDTTSSMSPYIEKSKIVIENMINEFLKNEEKPCFGIVAYRDHPPQDTSYVTKIHDLGPADTVLPFLKSLTAEGGGDIPEAVLQGLMDSIKKIKWRNLTPKDEKTYKKIIVHVGDAPPHGKQFHNIGYDAWPNGCPSQISLKSLSEQMNNNNIDYIFCRLTTKTDIMQKLFQENFKNFELNDLVITNEKMQFYEENFRNYKTDYKKDFGERNFKEMDYKCQQNVMYEVMTTNIISKKMKK